MGEKASLAGSNATVGAKVEDEGAESVDLIEVSGP